MPQFDPTRRRALTTGAAAVAAAPLMTAAAVTATPAARTHAKPTSKMRAWQIGSQQGLGDAAAALAYLQSGEHLGKIVIRHE